MNALAGTIVFFLHLLFMNTVCIIQKPQDLYKTVGRKAEFQWNSSTEILEAIWGLYDKQKDAISPKFFTVNFLAGIVPNDLSGTSYNGRVQYVGNITQGRAWFVLDNLELNDTNVYAAKIKEKGQNSKTFHVNLTVNKAPTTTSPPTTPSTTSTKPTTGTSIITTNTTARPSTTTIPSATTPTPKPTPKPGLNIGAIVGGVLGGLAGLLIGGLIGWWCWKKSGGCSCRCQCTFLSTFPCCCPCCFLCCRQRSDQNDGKGDVVLKNKVDKEGNDNTQPTA